MDRAQLIEDAAKAIYEAETEGLDVFKFIDPSWEARGARYQSRFLAKAKAALAVFEGAYTPSDDEREVLYSVVRKAIGNEDYGPHAWHLVTRDVLAAGFHRTMQGDSADDVRRAVRLWAERFIPGDRWDPEDAADLDAALSCIVESVPTAHDRRRTVQGEPSDAQVVAALNAYWAYDPPVVDPAYWSEKHKGIMRAALRAAAETGVER